MPADTALVEALERHGIPADALRPLIETAQGTIYGFAVHGSAAIPTWQRLRAIVEESVHWPVVLGDADDLQDHIRDTGDPYKQTTPQAIIESALALDPVELLKERLEGALPSKDE